MKLVTMTEYVQGIIEYVNESRNHKRGMDLIQWYSELLEQPLSFEMFRGEKPLFPDFKIFGSQVDATMHQCKQSVHPFGNDEFSITLYRESEFTQDEMVYATSYHLKKVEDLCGKGIFFDQTSEEALNEFYEAVEIV